MRKIWCVPGPNGGTRTLLLLAALLGVSLAGCLGEEEGVPDPVPDLEQTDDASLLVEEAGQVRDLRTDLRADDVIEAPTWTAGDQFGHHIFFGSDDTEGIHLDAVVYETTDTDAFLATPLEQAAIEHALFGLPVLGAVNAADLSSEGLGGLWKLYEFPMTDGATWQGEIPNIAFDIIEEDTVPLTFTARYEKGIETLGGTFPGFVIEGATDDGTLVVETDYVPEIRWYNRLLVHDIDPNDDPVEFEVRSMGHSRDWTGELFDITANVLVEEWGQTGFSAPPDQGGELVVEPQLPVGFDVGADATSLHVQALTYAVMGARESLLVDPDGERYEWQAVAGPMQDQFVGSRMTIDAVPGTWHWATVGAAPYSFAYLLVAELVYDTITLE